MSIPLLVVDVITVAAFVAFIIYYYGNWKEQRIAVIAAAFFAWYMSFLIVAVLPVDISVTYFLRCKQTHDKIPHLLMADLNQPVETYSNLSDIAIVSDNGTIVKQIPIDDGYNSTTSIPNLMWSNDITSDSVCESPWLMVNPDVLYYFWHVVYWTCQVLTWVILPIMRSYAQAGDFSVAGKIRTALIDNTIYYISYVVIFVVILIYLISRRDISLDWLSLKVLVITASNTWGLFLVILFLGYGLVAVPRALWWEASIPGSLSRAYAQVAKLNMERIEYEEALEDVVYEIYRYSNAIPSAHPLRKYLEIILNVGKLESGTNELLNAQSSAVQSGVSDSTSERKRRGDKSIIEGTGGGDLPSLKTLIRVHARLKVVQHRCKRAEAVWKQTLDRAAWLEEIERNLGVSGRRFQRNFQDSRFTKLSTLSGERASSTSIGESSRGGSGGSGIPGNDSITGRISSGDGGGNGRGRSRFPTLEWVWKCRIRAVVLRAAALIFGMTSIVLVFSECTFCISKPVVSIFALILHSAAIDYNYFFITLISLILIGYLSTCVYYTVFKMRIFNYFQLVPRHQTDENSLLFSGILLCNLTPPLCLNFLGMIHLDNLNATESPIEKASSPQSNFQFNSTLAGNWSFPQGSPPASITTYTEIMGHINVVWFIAGGFNIYFPILVLVLCTASLLRLGDRCLHRIGFSDFLAADDKCPPEVVNEGKCLLRKELLRRDRPYRTTTRLEDSSFHRATGTSQYRRFDMDQRRMSRDHPTAVNVNPAFDMTEMSAVGTATDELSRSDLGDLLDTGNSASTVVDAWDQSRLVIDDPMDFSEEAIAHYLSSAVAPDPNRKISA